VPYGQPRACLSAAAAASRAITAAAVKTNTSGAREILSRVIGKVISNPFSSCASRASRVLRTPVA
jgi:hypothetical protein